LKPQQFLPLQQPKYQHKRKLNITILLKLTKAIKH